MLITRGMQPVTEAYFGKTKTLLKAEQVIAKLIKKFRVSSIDKVPERVIKTVEINKSPLNKELESLFCEEFGFKECIIHWDGSNEENAYTVPRGIIKSLSADIPRLPIKQGDGKYYDAAHECLCAVNVYAGLIDMGMNAEEIMAVILHEIGHNFQCTPSDHLWKIMDFVWVPVTAYYTYTKAKETYVNGKAVKNLYNFMQNETDPAFIAASKAHIFVQLLTGLKNLYFLKDYIQMTFAAFSRVLFIETEGPEGAKSYFKEFDEYITNNKNKVLYMWRKYIEKLKKAEETKKNMNDFNLNIFSFTLRDIIIDLIMSPIPLKVKNIYDSYSGYSGEVFADSFATAYGYGGATASIQRKFEKMRIDYQWKYLNKDNKYLTYNQYHYVMLSILRSLVTDPHPQHQTRIKNQINKLKRELENDNIPPKVKALIKADLEQAEAQYNQFLKLDTQYQYLTIIQNWYHINEVYFNGKMDFRDYINRAINMGSDNSEA